MLLRQVSVSLCHVSELRSEVMGDMGFIMKEQDLAVLVTINVTSCSLSPCWINANINSEFTLSDEITFAEIQNYEKLLCC